MTTGLDRLRVGAVAGAAVLYAVALLATRPAAEADEAGPLYVGSVACRACHEEQFDAWAKSPMARAFDLLAPGREQKVEVGLDPTVDHRSDPKCLRCHTVGFEEPGGYRHGQDVVTALKSGLLGVGCESCHGAAARWLGEGLHDRALADPAVRYERRAFLAELGFVRVPGEDRCVACHNEGSPAFQPFDYEQRRDQGTHQHFEG